MDNGQSAGKSYAYLLGVFLGDGCAAKHRNKRIFKLNTKDKDFAITVKIALESISLFRVGMSKQVDTRWSQPVTMYQIYCCDNELCNRLIYDTKNKTVIPDYVFTWDKYLKKEFIIGLMDSEGFVAENKQLPKNCTQLTNRRFFMGFKSCDLWVPDFIKIIQSVGLKIGKVRQEKPLKDGYKVPTVFNIKMQSWIDNDMHFNIARKNERVYMWSKFGAYENRVKRPKRRLTLEIIRQTAKADDIIRSLIERQRDKQK